MTNGEKTEKLINGFLNHKKLIVTIFIVAGVICGFFATTVKTNYDMSDYLPEETASTQSYKVLEQEFTEGMPNARVMVENVSISQASNIKENLETVDGVESVLWLDDIYNMKVPVETLDNNTVKEYYKNGNAVYLVTISEDKQTKAIGGIREIVGETGAMSGVIIDSGSAMASTSKDIVKVILFAVPLVLLLLLITTSSWIEPLLFLFTIGIAVVLNMGTNAIFGEISYVTAASASVLQFAVSMDYSIFLLHRFSKYRNQGMDVQPAMVKAIKTAFASIFASGLTTIIGFGALIFMKFELGVDMGIVLAKGICFSMIAVLLLLPSLTVLFNKLIDKTHHRSFIPSFNKFGKGVLKVRVLAIVIITLISVPAFLSQTKTEFLYGASEVFRPDSVVTLEREKIDEKFGKMNQMAILVPLGDFSKEEELVMGLDQLKGVTSTISYVGSVGAEIPIDFLTENQKAQFFSENYSRIVVNSNVDFEGEKAFAFGQSIRDLCNKIYGNDYYLVGTTISTYDIKNVITEDNIKINLLAILGIGLVLFATFRNLILPFLLLISIESAIWINLSIPYFMDEKLIYLVYLIMMSIQLGATVDYAILFGTRYRDNIRINDKRRAIENTISQTAASILTSAIILAIAGFVLGIFSTNLPISQLGILLGRGALLSAASVLIALPALLYYFNKPIEKTYFFRRSNYEDE